MEPQLQMSIIPRWGLSLGPFSWQNWYRRALNRPITGHEKWKRMFPSIIQHIAEKCNLCIAGWQDFFRKGVDKYG